jgi:integrase/recombinase XerD
MNSALGSGVAGGAPLLPGYGPQLNATDPALGRRLMAEAEGGELTPKQQATGYRDGLMIALLAARPLRRKNFTRIEVGRHLVREGANWQLRIAGEETKTGRPIAQPFPAVLVPSLERYLAVHRPVLAALPGHQHRPAGAALWLSARGTPMAEITLYTKPAKY